MGALRYLLVIALLGVLSILTVAEHVKRTQIGYEVRKLEQRRARLLEERKAAQVAFEQAVVPEQLIQRSGALGVADPAELRALSGVRK